MELEIVKFMREHPDWEALIAEEPYYLKTSWDGNYCLIKYNQLASDFSNKMVRECRGIIFYAEEDGTMTPVCVPFFKFGNYGEGYADEIDWSSAKVQEKIDGSLIKIWWHQGWHISTNNTIDASKAVTWVEGISFKDKVAEALSKVTGIETFFETLHPDYTYIFELVSPETRVVIPYDETKLYYLGCRNNLTFEENWKRGWMDCCVEFGMARPREYNLFSLKDCIAYTQGMSKDEEGFVVVDADWHRVKIKSPEYLIAHKLRNNNVITLKNVVTMIMNDTVDDFLAYADDYKEFVLSIVNAYLEAQRKMERAWQTMVAEFNIDNVTKLGFYENAKKYPIYICDYLCTKFDKKTNNPIDFLKYRTRPYIIKMIKCQMNREEEI